MKTKLLYSLWYAAVAVVVVAQAASTVYQGSHLVNASVSRDQLEKQRVVLLARKSELENTTAKQLSLRSSVAQEELAGYQPIANPTVIVDTHTVASR